MKYLWTIVAVMVSASAGAQNAFSPKLNQFLLDHSVIYQTLSNAMVSAATGRKVELYYFYAGGGAAPKAHHHYIGDMTTVGIFVQENQSACDECISILFETLNSKREPQFLKLFNQVLAGTIKKEEFVREMMREELKAVIETQELLLKWPPEEVAKAGSEDYAYFAKAPKRLEDFLAYSSKNSHGSYQKGYEELYDKMRGSSQR
jgi:hypothetical protein